MHTPARQGLSTTCIDCRSDYLLDPLSLLLHWNAVELTKEIAHLTVDKKAFTRLLIYLNYHYTHFAERYRDIFTTHPFFRALPEQIVYYIYTLHKIVV